MTYKEFNDRIGAILEQSVQTDGIINIFDKDEVEISLFDEAFLAEISNMKQKNIAVETLKRLISEQVKTYSKRSV